VVRFVLAGFMAGCGLGVVGEGAAPPTEAPETPASPPSPRSYPQSCAETSPDGDTTLFVDGDPGKPWPAHCGPAGETYLRLAAGRSYSSYPEGNCATGSVRTTWRFVRIDPRTFLVTTNDYAGATSEGEAHEISGNGSVDKRYRRMPFGTGRSCDASERLPVARVDLEGTPFVVATAQVFEPQGFRANGAEERSPRAVTLEISGAPAGIHPCADDYYQEQGGACLQLAFRP